MDTNKLRQKILDLAIRGKLVPQDPNDEPASAFIEKIRAEKERLIKEKKIKRDKNESYIYRSDKSYYEKFADGTEKCIDEDIPFEIPVSWEWCRLGSVAFYKKGPFGSSITKSMFIPESENAIKIYEQKNAIYKNAEIGNYYISEEKFDELKGFQVFPNDIIVSCAGTIGETFVMPKEIRKGIINQALMRIKLYDYEMLDFYLMYFDFMLKNQANEQGKGTAIKNIPPFDILKNFLLPLPPLKEQYRIRNFIQKINEKINCVDSDKNGIFALVAQTKSKILDLAIRGKLVPQDSSDESASVLLERIKAEHSEIKKKASKTSDNSHYENLPFEIPENWAWCQLDDILDYEQPTEYIVQTTNYSDLYKTPVLTAGKSFVIGYTNEEKGIFRNTPVIIFDDFTTESKYVDFEFKVKSSAMKILKTNQHVNLRYVFYYMSITKLIGESHKRYWISEYSKLCIPIPPYREQVRIVNEITKLFSALDKIAEDL